MTLDDILRIAVKLYASEEPEEDGNALVHRLRRELPRCGITDLMFHDYRTLTSEQVHAEAAQHRKASPH